MEGCQFVYSQDGGFKPFVGQGGRGVREETRSSKRIILNKPKASELIVWCFFRLHVSVCIKTIISLCFHLVDLPTCNKITKCALVCTNNWYCLPATETYVMSKNYEWISSLFHSFSYLVALLLHRLWRLWSKRDGRWSPSTHTTSPFVLYTPHTHSPYLQLECLTAVLNS